jgi:hypothetical protein
MRLLWIRLIASKGKSTTTNATLDCSALMKRDKSFGLELWVESSRDQPLHLMPIT